MNKKKSIEYPQHSLSRSIGLHLLPGILVTAAFIGLKSLLKPSGFPPLLAFLLAVFLTGLPVMLGVMLAEGKKITGRFSLEGVVLYREKVPWKSFILIFICAFLIVYILTIVMTPITDFLTESVFSWLPDWFFLDEQTQYQIYARDVLRITFAMQFVLTGLLLPWVEELYFRGYLMPRISRYGKWAPVLSGIFFGLYHIWQLYSFPAVFLLGTILSYVMWWKKDIRLSISLHVFANAVIRLMLLLSVLM